mgnify:CR=1 FL=1
MKGRILSGMRPTGRLHLGNYEGALRNWVALQEDYEMFCMIADWHALTTEYEHPQEVRKITREVALAGETGITDSMDILIRRLESNWPGAILGRN